MTQPVLPFTYADLICDEDVDLFARETTSDLQNLIQDVTHILEEFPGTNPDDPDRGIGVSMYLSGDVSKLNGLPGKIEEQLGRDDRIDAVDASVAPNTSVDNAYIIRIEIAVSGSVINLQYGYSSVTGLINQTGI